jgi:indole-3-acetate monooxygenase
VTTTIERGTADVDGLLALIRDRVGDVDRDRRLPEDVVGALRGTGINRLALPTVLGGAQAPVVELVELIERISAVDGSVGWCAAIGAGSNVFAGYISEAGAGEVFADPDQSNASVFAPLGNVVDDGGRRLLTGRWPFTSNCLHSAWVGVGAFVANGDGAVDPVPRLVFVPKDDVTIEDTWHAVGLRGTGSHHVSANALPVELDRSCAFSDRPWPEGTLWRLPLFSVLIPPLTAVNLGIARGALDHVSEAVRNGRPAMRGQLADDPISMGEFAIADCRLRAARAALIEAVHDAHGTAERGDPVDRRLQARVLLASLHACDVAVDVTSTAHRLGGGAAYAASPLLRALRDVETARQHMVFSHQHRAELGKALAGLEVVYPPFLT